MRTALLVGTLVALSGCGPDPLIGSYSFTISGTDTTTAPSNSVSNPTGTGTLSVTNNKGGGFLLTVAQTDNYACVLEGTRGLGPGHTIEVSTGQTCTFVAGLGTVTATMTSGTATLTISGEDTMSLAVGYSFAGTNLGINYAGTGNRTYAGPRQ